LIFGRRSYFVRTDGYVGLADPAAKAAAITSYLDRRKILAEKGQVAWPATDFPVFFLFFLHVRQF
jgi:hypothetical protein